LIKYLLQINKENLSLEEYKTKAKENPNNYYTILKHYLLHNSRLVVLNVDNLKTKVIKKAYNRLATIYPKRNKTRKLI
ncbi:hypothetical protein CONLIGDRAFT_562472, partial [Coniochaeta ligniaria NRRL 30616]